MFSKKKKHQLKIQDVSADCPEYAAAKAQKGEGGAETGKKSKKIKKKKMRKLRTKKRNPILVLLVLVGILLAGGVAFYFFGIPFLGGKSTVYVEKVSNIMGLGSGNGTLNRYAGIVESQGEWIVTVDGETRVKEVYVAEGDEVEVGDRLFAYDEEELRLSLEQARLELSRMESELEAGEHQIAALEEEKEYASSSEELEIEIQIQSLKANNKKTEYEIKNQNARIEELEEASENVVITSELAGVVKKVDKSVTNGEVYGETDFITILAAGDYRIRAMINEQNQWSIEEGKKVIIRSRVDDTQTWTGKILTIDTGNPEQNDASSYGENAELTTSSRYPFYVKLDSSEGLLLGQHVYVEPDEGQDLIQEGVWLEGYYFVQEEGHTYVWARNSFGLLEKREITLGTFREGLGKYQILSGLEKDDYIAFPVEGLWPGMRTAKEAEKEENAGGLDADEDDTFEIEDESFQEFESGGDGSGEDGSDDHSPVGSISSPAEVLV